MNYISAIILGIVEGITEFLPISSTGHLMLAAELLKIKHSGFLATFEIAIQLGAILSVVCLYWKTLLIDKKTFLRIAVAFIPTAVAGLLCYKLLKQFLLNQTQIVLWSLFIGGIFLIIFELCYREKKNAVEDIRNVSYRQAFLIGLIQAIAIIPGVSRAGATIIAGLSLGLKRKTIVEFSFLLAVPTMAAATGFDLYKSAPAFTKNEFLLLLIGFITSFIVAIAAIKLFLTFIKKHTFIPFGIYRILLALLFWLSLAR